MAEKFIVNHFTGKFDATKSDDAYDARYLQIGDCIIPQITADPASPDAESAWVLRSGSGGAIADGTPIGLLLALTYKDNAGVAYSYALKYRTKDSTTLSVALT